MHSSTTNTLKYKQVRNNAHLALQIERRGVRKCAFSPQLRCERTQRLEHALSLGAARRHDARAEFLGRTGFRSEHRGVVVDPGIDQQGAVIARTVGGAKTVDAAGLNIDARDLNSVVCCEYRELDGAAPGLRREDCPDVLIARMTFEERKKARRATRREVSACVGSTDCMCGRTLG